MKVNCFLCGFTHLSCINEHKNRIRKSFIKANKVLKNGNQVGETGAHWDTGYSGTIHILEILRKRMPL